MTDTALPALRRSSPLGARSTQPTLVARGSGIEVHEAPFLAQVLLRMTPTGTALDDVGTTLGLGLPEANRMTGSERELPVGIWLGPDEWLVLDRDEPADLERRVLAASVVHGGTVTDVSAQRTVLVLSGAGVRDLLAAGTSVDLHPRSFPVGAAAQTQLARVDVIIGRDRDDSYLVAVRTSFARYLVDWLEDALQNLEGMDA